MANIVDERGYNQIFKSSRAQAIRVRRRAEAMVQAMRLPEAPDERKGIHIMEIGCGMGELAHHLVRLTGARVTGVDLSPKFIEQARVAHRLPQLDFQVMDIFALPPAAPDQRYDFIVGNGILHHLYHGLDHVLARLQEWLVPGGRLIFWEPNLHNPYVYLIFSFPRLRRLARLEPGEMAFTRNFIATKLARTGYTDIVVARRDFLLPNTPGPFIRPAIALGQLIERVPPLAGVAPSLFIQAVRPPEPK